MQLLHLITDRIAELLGSPASLKRLHGCGPQVPLVPRSDRIDLHTVVRWDRLVLGIVLLTWVRFDCKFMRKAGQF